MRSGSGMDLTAFPAMGEEEEEEEERAAAQRFGVSVGPLRWTAGTAGTAGHASLAGGGSPAGSHAPSHMYRATAEIQVCCFGGGGGGGGAFMMHRAQPIHLLQLRMIHVSRA